ncbi:hypothetical protein ACFORG_16130 [Lutimaribacter marinistellae]|uniref:Uncharacterized protein n=1 Tax=Lutimaribacter marinistellae TaxID=1820329 RepID=A0ABV7TK45_9RHOB
MPEDTRFGFFRFRTDDFQFSIGRRLTDDGIQGGLQIQTEDFQLTLQRTLAEDSRSGLFELKAENFSFRRSWDRDIRDENSNDPQDQVFVEDFSLFDLG